MRKSLAILLLVEFVVAIVLGQMATVHQSEFDRAFVDWQRRLTAESREVFERQKRIREAQRLGFSGVVFGLVACVTILVYRIRRGDPIAPPNGPQHHLEIRESPMSVASQSEVREGRYESSPGQAKLSPG